MIAHHPYPPRRREGFKTARFALALVLLALCAVPVFAQQTAPAGPAAPAPLQLAEPPVAIEIKARPIEAFLPGDPTQLRFGALEFRGGLELTSSHRRFGGLSGLHIMADGERFLALNDRGWWLRGRLIYEGARPVAVADAEIAPMLAASGRPLAVQGWYDAESLAVDGNTAYVGLERVNRIVRFDIGKFGLRAPAVPIVTPPGIGKLPYNRGLESLALVPQGLPGAGTLIAISERGLDAQGNLKAFLIGGPTPGEFSVARHGDFDASDCAILPSGDLALLERSFGWIAGIGMRIRRIPLADLKPGAVVDGPALIVADMGYQIDNMEGLSVHKTAAGETVLTLISDDNFLPLQRTILLQFTLVGE